MEEETYLVLIYLCAWKKVYVHYHASFANNKEIKIQKLKVRVKG